MSMFIILVGFSMMPAFADANTQPTPGNAIHRRHGSPSMRSHDTGVRLTGSGDALRGTGQKDADGANEGKIIKNEGTIVLGGVDIGLVPLPSHPKVARGGVHITNLAHPQVDTGLVALPSHPKTVRGGDTVHITNLAHPRVSSTPPGQTSSQQLYADVSQNSSMPRTSENPKEHGVLDSPDNQRREVPGLADHEVPMHSGSSRAVSPAQEDEDGTRHTPLRPPLYGILSAIAASLGYAVLMIMRFKGWLHELAPKPPLSGFMRSHLDRATSENGQSRRKNRKTIAKFCPSRFNAQAAQVAGTIEENKTTTDATA